MEIITNFTMIINKLFSKLFAIDTRALAVFRIGLGLVLIYDLALRLPGIEMFYTDRGVLPRDLAISALGRAVGLSVYLASGDLWFQVAIFFVVFVAALALIMGYRTRTATIICWLHVISICSRNPKNLNGGDNFLWMMLLWAIFVPLAARYSLDAKNKTSVINFQQNTVVSFATAALLLQVVILYLTTAYLKIGPDWLSGEALYYALTVDFHCKPFARYLLNFPSLLPILTYATLALEFIGPFLLLYPFKHKFIRVVGFASFALLHIGIFLTMRIGIFPFISIVSMIPFLPSFVWDKILGKSSDKFNTENKEIKATTKPSGETFLNILAGLLFAYVLWWNLGNINEKLKMPNALAGLAYPFKLQQKWRMFSSSSRYDGWFVISAELDDGTMIDLFKDGAPLDWERPNDVSSSFEHFRQKQYLIHLLPGKTPKGLLSRYCLYLKSKWEPRINATGRKLIEIRLYFMVEKTLPNNQIEPMNKRLLWRLDNRDK